MLKLFAWYKRNERYKRTMIVEAFCGVMKVELLFIRTPVISIRIIIFQGLINFLYQDVEKSPGFRLIILNLFYLLS